MENYELGDIVYYHVAGSMIRHCIEDEANPVF